MKQLLLIDANSIIHRAFHALPPLSAPDGRPTGALYGLASALLKIFREDKPDYVAACFDRPEPTFREEKYPEYKAHRPPTPPELVSQLVEAPELFREFGIKTFDRPGMEADDLIAALVQKFGGEPELKAVILTGDLDTLQLVRGEKVVVRAFKKGVSETQTYDAAAVQKRYGLSPEQMVDYKALVGDPSDNVKGVPGIGPKTAQAILSQAGGLEEFFKSPEKYPKFKDKLLPWRKELELNRELVALRAAGGVGAVGLSELKPDFNPQALAARFRELGFETLVRRMESGPEPAEKPRQGKLEIGN
jgi:DNA polymerase-1